MNNSLKRTISVEDTASLNIIVYHHSWVNNWAFKYFDNFFQVYASKYLVTRKTQKSRGTTVTYETREFNVYK